MKLSLGSQQKGFSKEKKNQEFHGEHHLASVLLTKINSINFREKKTGVFIIVLIG